VIVPLGIDKWQPPWDKDWGGRKGPTTFPECQKAGGPFRAEDKERGLDPSRHEGMVNDWAAAGGEEFVDFVGGSHLAWRILK